MRFLWKSQLRNERGRLVPKSAAIKKKTNRKERLDFPHSERTSSIGVASLWLLLLGTTLYVLFFSPYLLVTTAEVRGGEDIGQESMQQFVNEKLSGKYLYILPKNSFFLVSPKKLERALKAEYPLVRGTDITRVFPRAIHMQVIPREKIVRFCVENACYHVLEDGSVADSTEIFEKEVNHSRTLFVRDLSDKPLRTGREVFPPSFVPFVIALKESLKSRLDIDTENTFTVSSRFANELRAKSLQGFEIYFSTERPLDASLDALALLFEKEIPGDKRVQLKYVDLRTENRIYYVFQDGVNTAGEMAVPEDKKEEKKKEEKKKK